MSCILLDMPETKQKTIIKKPLIDNVHTPKVRWHPLINYELKNLERDFAVADFERRTSKQQVFKLITNILKNDFYNICFHVIEVNKKWVIIDGQHRLMAFQQLRDRYGLKTFDFMLAIHDKTYGRETYRLLNIGKKLTSKDHTKAIDDGTIPFFDALRPYLDHYKKWDTMTFSDLLFAHNYAIKANPEGSINVIDDILKTITPDVIKQMIAFCDAIKTLYPSIADEPVYRSAVYRPLYKICFKNHMTKEQIMILIKNFHTDEELPELSRGRRISNFVKMEKLIGKYK